MPVSAIRKETAVPGTFAPHEEIFVARADNPALMDHYFADATGTALRHTLRTEDVQAMIAAAGISGGGSALVATDIAARDAIDPAGEAIQVLVLDASADATVAAGAATYVWVESQAAWVKISEAESMDVSLAWSAITGRPTSTPAQIDAAVTASHTHSNITQLNQIGQDGDGNLTYNGQLPRAALINAAW